jgi:hypothetical protein
MPLNNDNYEARPASADQPAEHHVSRICYPLFRSIFWMRLTALSLITSGALITITGIGVLVAWLPILLGVLLLATTRPIKRAYQDNDERALTFTMQRFRTLFMIMGGAGLLMLIATGYLAWYMVRQSALL